MATPELRTQRTDAGDDPAEAGSPRDVSRIAVVLDEYVHLWGAGQRPERSEFLARHAAIAEELAECLDGLEFVLSAQDELLSVEVPEESIAEALTPSTHLGDYRIIREVGRGGMGVVYEAEQLPLGRRVALKVLPSAAALDGRQRQRFQLEAQAVALLEHEHIVPIYGFGCDQGVPYYAMPFIDGPSLAEIIRERRAAGGPEAPLRDWPGGKRPGPCAEAESRMSRSDGDAYRTVAWYGVQAAEALQHAHDAGVIHRDIKPSNLMVDSRDRLWVTDFGLAHLPQDEPSLTRTGDLVGTLRYMSPEQVRGARHAIDGTTDIYALGLTLYELLTLRPAFVAADRQDLLRRILQDEPTAPRRLNPAIPRDLETIVLKAIAKEPAARYHSARELAKDLRRFREDRPIQARRPNLLERTARWSRRHRPVVVTAASVLMLTLSVSTALLWRAKRQTDWALASLSRENEKVDVALSSHRRAMVYQRLAYESSIEFVDRITDTLAYEGGGSEPRRGGLADQVYRMAIQHYDKILKVQLEHQLLSEVAAKVSRRAGFLRMILGESEGRQDYERAIRTYEEVSRQHPDFFWLRSGRLETLCEYAGRLLKSGETAAAEPLLRRALELAEELAGDKAAVLLCYHMALIDPFNGLAWHLLTRPHPSPAETALAIRLARQAVTWEESAPVPGTGPIIAAPVAIKTPGLPAPRTTLGVALCRAGEWSAAASALAESMAETDGDDPRDALFLAIVRHREGHTAAALHWYDRALRGMANHSGQSRDPELGRLRAEAETELGRLPVLPSPAWLVLRISLF